MPIAVYRTPVASQSSRTRSSAPARTATTARPGRLADQRLELVQVEGPRDPCASAVPQHALPKRLREPAAGHILGPIEQPFGGRADEDIGQLPLSLKDDRRREPAQQAVLDTPPSAAAKPLTIMG